MDVYTYSFFGVLFFIFGLVLMAVHSKDYMMNNAHIQFKNYIPMMIILSVLSLIYYNYDIANARDIWGILVPLTKTLLVVWFIKCGIDHAYTVSSK